MPRYTPALTHGVFLTPNRWTERAALLDTWLNARPVWQRLVFLVFLMLPCVACGAWKPLTNDEIFTFEVARLGSLSGIWRALAAGADNHPPLDYMLRHISMALFGQGELA